LKVTVPVGVLPPETVAASLKDPPCATDVADNVVETLGVTLPTLTISEPHALDAPLLLPSPL
jgi:hypothetical protein